MHRKINLIIFILFSAAIAFVLIYTTFAPKDSIVGTQDILDVKDEELTVEHFNLDYDTDQYHKTYEAVEVWKKNQEWLALPKVMYEWYQTDAEWANLQYAGNNTIATNGCGLVSAAMALSYVDKIEFDPIELRELVGDSCTTDTLNDMEKFSKFVNSEFNVQISDRYNDPWKAITDAKNGSAVICSTSGKFGDSYYGGHIVVLYSDDGENLRIRDPASKGNSNRIFSPEEFCSYYWAYFYTWTKEEL